jgi:hypothetical protein
VAVGQRQPRREAVQGPGGGEQQRQLEAKGSGGGLDRTEMVMAAVCV